MPLASFKLKAAQVLEIVAFAPILAALLLGSLPVLLAINICRLATHRRPLAP